MANPSWFNEAYYLTSKLEQLQTSGETAYTNVLQVKAAIEAAGMTVYEHFSRFSLVEETNPNQYFNTGEYLAAKADQAGMSVPALLLAFQAAGFANAYDHFARHGWLEDVNPSNVFDVSQYLADKALESGLTVAAVTAAFVAGGFDPISHFVEYGEDEGIVVTPVPADEQVDGGTGETFTLTADIETLTGTAGNDTFRGTINNDGVDNDSTVQTGDIINGGAGMDKLEITVAADQGTAPLLELNSVEQVFIRQLDGLGPNDIDAALWTGVQQIWSNKSLEDLGVDNVTAAVTIGMVDTKADFDVTYENDALGSDEATQAFALTNVGSANVRPVLQVNLGGSDEITTVSFAVTGENIVEYEDDDDSTTLIVTGTGSLDIYQDAEFDNVTTADFSGNSGGVTVELEHEDMVVTGGSGDDVLTITNSVILTDKAGIALGAGDDSLLSVGSVGVGTDAVLDGGAGTDTISSLLLEVGNQANIQNWEILDIAGESRTVDASLFTKSSFQSLALSAATVGATAVTKLSGTSVVLDVAGTAAINNVTGITATLATATGTSDTGEINFNNDGDVTLAAFNTAGLETIAISSNGENAADDNEITVLNTTDNVLTTITITGDKEFKLGDVNTNTSATTASADVASSLTLIDGSAATGDLNITAGQAAAIGASGFSTTYNSLTIKTGEIGRAHV